MSSLRRHMMMQQGGGVVTPYVPNGLVFWLDGIDKGGVNNSWIDIIGGAEFYPVGRGVVFAENGVNFTNRQSYLKLNGTYEKPYLNYTIEIAFVGNSGKSGSMFFFDKSPRYPAIIERGGSIFSTYSSGDSYDRVSIQRMTFKTLSMSRYDVVADKDIVNTKFSVHDYLSPPPITISSERSYFCPIGIMHSIRIYSRNLSVDEMIYNQRIDNERFNLGLTI